MKLPVENRTEIMGISILWVMLFHAGIPAPDNLVLRALWYLFVSFGGGIGVDIFLLCSGMGLMWSAINRERRGVQETLGSFYRRRLRRLLPAYLLLGFVYYLYLLLAEGTGRILYNLLFLNFMLEGKRDFWYILAALLCYLQFPVYRKLGKRIGCLWASVLAVWLSYLVTWIVFLISPLCFQHWEIVLLRLPCFWIGCCLGWLIADEREKAFYLFVGLLFLAFAVLALVYGFLPKSSTVLRVEFALLSPLVMLAFAFLVELLRKLPAAVQPLTALGTISLELYLTHISFGHVLKEWVKRVSGSHAAVLVAYFVFSILIAWLLHRGLETVAACRKRQKAI